MNQGEKILAMQDRRMESLIVPEWNDEQVFVRTMGALERANYEAKLIENKDASTAERMVSIKVCLVVLCACDKDGNRLFTDDQAEELSAKNGRAIDRVFDVINHLNKVTEPEIEEEAGN